MRTEKIGSAILFNGDCRDVLPLAGRIQTVVTDPPYGVAKEGYNDSPAFIREQIIPRVVEILALPTITASITPGTRHALLYPPPRAMGCVFFPFGMSIGPWGHECFQPILYYGIDPYIQSGRGPRPNSVWGQRHWFSEKVEHPSSKPVMWMKWQVERTSLPGWCVFDPFMGSGSTGVACMRLGRPYIGSEIDSDYFDLACRRIEDATRQADMFITPISPKQEAIQWSL